MKKNPYKGKFILLEGIDGSGKTTQTRLLVERMAREGMAAYQTREPTSDNMFGRLARFIYMCESLHEKASAELEGCLQGAEYRALRAMYDELQLKHITRFEGIAHEVMRGDYKNLQTFLQLTMIFDRYHHHVDTIIPQLERGVHVAADRDFLSTLAYSAGDDIPWRPLLQAHVEILGDAFIAPDLTFFIDIPVNIGIERTMAKQQGKKDYFDTDELLSKIRARYVELSESSEIIRHTPVARIQGSDASPEVVHELIWPYCRSLIADGDPHRVPVITETLT